jgi:hypothetical protein
VRDRLEKVTDGCLGLWLVASLIVFFGSIYYACEAYPSVVRTEVEGARASITLKVGSLCDPPDVLVGGFALANPSVEIEGYSTDTEWGARTLKIKFKKKEK